MKPMEGQDNVDPVLEYALFQLSSAENSYNALTCINGKLHKLSSGSLDQLSLHFQQVKGFSSKAPSSSFKLIPTGGVKGSLWFTKSTLSRVLHFINSPEAMMSANALVNEMSQLEDTRQFHLALYTKDQQLKSDGDIEGGKSRDSRSSNNVKAETSSDDTKNELLRALDLRLTALREELAISMNQAAGVSLSVNHIPNLLEFVEHFGLSDLRSHLLKYRSLIPEDQMDESCTKSVNIEEPVEDTENFTEEVCQSDARNVELKTLYSGVSPAKIAEAERQCSSESEDSSESSNEDNPAVTERSRPLVRSASPRRSASPMRRIQIGRSGSRRSTALTIKSLSYLPTRERASSNCEDDEGNNTDEEPHQPPQKPDVNVTRISVQDAISMFERKQKDQNTDDQRRRASGVVSLSTNKSVLRRWSSGTSESLNCSQESVSKPTTKSHPITTLEVDDNTATLVEAHSENSQNTTSASETAVTLSEGDKMMLPPNDSRAELTTSQDEVIDKEITVVDWNQQKEAELNQMLLKMMENKPGKYRDTKSGRSQILASSNEKRGGFYSQYKEKRDEKLRAENDKKRSVMEAQFKVLKETLEQSKTGIASKSGSTKKPDSPLNSQKPRRNSSPPVLSKKEVPKAAPAMKALPKATPLPSTRGSWSPGSLTKANDPKQTKTSPKQTSNITPPNRKKPHPTSSPAPPSPRPEKLLPQLKEKPIKRTDTTKSPVASKEEKTQKPTTKTKKNLQNKPQLASQEDTTVVSGKPRIYSKATKKSTVVPLEGKHTPRKGVGNGSAIGSVGHKAKVSQSDESSKNSGNLVQTEEKESAPKATESTDKVLEVDPAQQPNDVDANLEISLDNNLNLEKTEISDGSLAALDDGLRISVEHHVAEIQPDEDIISAAAWVEVEQEVPSVASPINPSNVTVSPIIASPALSSLHIRHSLSQMLQADSSEPEIIEWGNAENPPALIYQKDAPKGFKRLLKFARKSKGDSNLTGCASPSIYSEGEEDNDDYKAVNRKNSDISRRAAIAKSHGSQRTMLSDTVDAGNMSKRDYQGENEMLAAQPSTNAASISSDKLWDSNALSAATSSKSSRSFFSFSTFRSGKSGESKPR